MADGIKIIYAEDPVKAAVAYQGVDKGILNASQNFRTHANVNLHFNEKLVDILLSSRSSPILSINPLLSQHQNLFMPVIRVFLYFFFLIVSFFYYNNASAGDNDESSTDRQGDLVYEKKIYSQYTLEFNDTEESTRSLVLETLDNIFKKGLADHIQKGNKVSCFYKQRSNCETVAAFVLSLGMGFSLISVYKGDQSALTVAAKTSAFLAGMPLGIRGVLAAKDEYKEKIKEYDECCVVNVQNDDDKSEDILHSIVCKDTDLNIKELSDSSWETVSLTKQDKIGSTLGPCGLMIATVISLIDSSFDAFLAGKTGFNLLNQLGGNLPVIPKFFAAAITGVWNFLPNTGCAFLGAVELVEMMRRPSSLAEYYLSGKTEEGNIVDSLLEDLIVVPDDWTNDIKIKKLEARIIHYLGTDSKDFDLEKVLEIRRILSEKANKAFDEEEKKETGMLDNPAFQRILRCSWGACQLTAFLAVSAATTAVFSADQMVDLLLSGGTETALAVGGLAAVVYTVQGFNINMLAFNSLKNAKNFFGYLTDRKTKSVIDSLRPSYIKSRLCAYLPASAMIAGAYAWNLWGVYQPIAKLIGLGSTYGSVLNEWTNASISNNTDFYTDWNEAATEWSSDNPAFPVMLWGIAAASLGGCFAYGAEHFANYVEHWMDTKRKKLTVGLEQSKDIDILTQHMRESGQ